MHEEPKDGVAPTNSHPVTANRPLLAGVSRQRAVGVDWLTLSIARTRNVEEIMRQVEDLLGCDGVPARGQHGYAGWKVAGGYGSLLKRKSGKAEDIYDVLLMLPGRALDWMGDIGALNGMDTPTTDQAICQYFRSRGWKATRIDVVIDTTDAEVNPAVVKAIIDAGGCITRAKNIRYIQNQEINGEYFPGVGETLYVGGRQSSRLMRCYDKRQEILRAIGEDIGHLTRFELEVKRDAAGRVFRKIAEKGAEIIPSLFSGWISFKDPTDRTKRKDRRRNVDWWERLIGEAEPIKLGLMRGVSTPETQLHWLIHQVAKTLQIVDEAGLSYLIEEAKRRKASAIKESERQMWAGYLARLEARQQGGPDDAA